MVPHLKSHLEVDVLNIVEHSKSNLGPLFDGVVKSPLVDQVVNQIFEYIDIYGNNQAGSVLEDSVVLQVEVPGGDKAVLVCLVVDVHVHM